MAALLAPMAMAATAALVAYFSESKADRRTREKREAAKRSKEKVVAELGREEVLRRKREEQRMRYHSSKKESDAADAPAPMANTDVALVGGVVLDQVVAAPGAVLPCIQATHCMPQPALPTEQACGKPLPDDAFNPFELQVPKGTWSKTAAGITANVEAMLGGLPATCEGGMLTIPLRSIGKAIDFDSRMAEARALGFFVHSDVDILLIAFNTEVAASTLAAVMERRDAKWVMDQAESIAPLIADAAKRACVALRFNPPVSGAHTFGSHTSHAFDSRGMCSSKTHSTEDDYTTGFGISTGSLNTLQSDSPETLARCIAAGGVRQVAFQNARVDPKHGSVSATRAGLRKEQSAAAAAVHASYRNEWLTVSRPRVTAAHGAKCGEARAPFILNASLPLATNHDQVRLSEWESALRAVEEELLVSIFGCCHNVTWARILAKVYEGADAAMGAFDVANYRQWVALKHICHRGSPSGLGSPWRGATSRLLNKGANGIQSFKTCHDDHNSMLGLGVWTAVTKGPQPTDLVFYLNGHACSLEVTAGRYAGFMGWIPHETCRRRAPVARAAATTSNYRVHHSAFGKPEADNLAAHVLSRLPVRPGGGDWRMAAVGNKRMLRHEAFDGMHIIGTDAA